MPALSRKGGFGTGPSLAALAKQHSLLPVIANGSLHDAGRAASLVEGGDADVVSLGRMALTHADWPRRVRDGGPIGEFERDILSPITDLENADRRRAELALARG